MSMRRLILRTQWRERKRRRAGIWTNPRSQLLFTLSKKNQFCDQRGRLRGVTSDTNLMQVSAVRNITVKRSKNHGNNFGLLAISKTAIRSTLTQEHTGRSLSKHTECMSRGSPQRRGQWTACHSVKFKLINSNGSTLTSKPAWEWFIRLIFGEYLCELLTIVQHKINSFTL